MASDIEFEMRLDGEYVGHSEMPVEYCAEASRSNTGYHFVLYLDEGPVKAYIKSFEGFILELSRVA
jgi:hypothetical protein